MKIDRSFLKEKWYKFNDEVSFKIAPFPFSQHKSTEVMDMVFEQFLRCVVDWKGIVDEDNKEFKCNKANKKFLYDFYPDIRDFVFDKSRMLSGKLDEESKN